MRTRDLLAVITLLAVSATPVLAQRPRIVRGTIDSIHDATFSLKPAEGADLTVKLSNNAKVFGVKAATIADVKPGDWIGVGAMPQPDGSQKAIEVTIFSQAQRGVGEGFRPWTRPGSTMTNGTAGNPVASVNGQTVMVKYKGGEQKIVIGPDAKIRMYVSGTRDELKLGAHVAVYNPQKAPDGSLQTARINVGLGDMVP
ncbi:MAG: DUF5666 domain-containing protein [Pseudomonadota bacterium]